MKTTVLRGRIENGVVVLENGTGLPEGTQVSVVIETVEGEKGRAGSQEELQRRQETIERIRALPDENPGGTFSGADHDRVLYGDG